MVAGICAMAACTPAWTPPPPDIHRPSSSVDYENWLHTGELR